MKETVSDSQDTFWATHLQITTPFEPALVQQNNRPFTERFPFTQMLTSTKYQMELQVTPVYALLLRIGFQYSP